VVSIPSPASPLILDPEKGLLSDMITFVDGLV